MGEDEGTAQPVVFTERLKSGYSTARNDVLRHIWEKRQNIPEKWQDVGPDNLGGRVTCLIAKSGSGGNSLMVGAACGGVWDGNVHAKNHRPSDGNGSDPHLQCKWQANPATPKNPDVDETFLMHNIGSLAISGETIYCGTGNAYYAGDSFPGVGLFRSEGDATTWTQLKNTSKDFPRRISTIAAHDNEVWIGGVVLPQEDESEEPLYSGIFRSSNKGETWRRDTFKIDTDFARRFGVSREDQAGIFKDRDYQCHSIIFLENGAKVILAAITAPLSWGGIWRYREGKGWEQLTRGLPSPREFGRTSLAVARTSTNQSVVYAFIGAADGRCLGVYRSSDGGDHWIGRGRAHFAAVRGLNYVNCLAVSPADPDIVVCGARDLHRSVDGGQTWTQITEWFAAPDSRGYSHADHHALLWPVENRLYSANDGGVDVSHDNGITWRNLTDGLAVTMFYDIDVAASFGSENSPNLIIAGGAQDNASVMTDFRAAGIGYVPTCLGVQLGLNHRMAGGAADKLQGSEEVIVNVDGSGMAEILSTPGVQLISSSAGNAGTNAKVAHDFKEILDGDGGWTVFDPGNPLHVYGSSQNMTIYRHRRDTGWQEVTPEDATGEERNRIWMAIIAMHPRDPNIVFTGSTRVWRTNNDGDDWIAVSDDLDGSPISAIEIAENDPNFIYVGTVNGNIFKSEDGGNRWADESGEDEPKPMEWRKDLHERLTIGVARTITRIEAHPNHARRIAVTLMGFDGKNSLPHVLWFDGEKVKDESKTKWIDLSDADKGEQAALPNLHHNVLTWDESGRYLFVGNDIGVWTLRMTNGGFATKDGKHDWVDISAGLPNALVTDLVYHKISKSLTAATYGRSLYWAGEKVWTRLDRGAHNSRKLS